MRVAICRDCLLDSDVVYIVDHFIDPPAVCSRCEREALILLDGEANEPRLVSGVHPEVFTTCADMQPLPLVRHDTNCYYRHLGVAFDATKRQIKSAYQSCQGEMSTRLTMIAKTLLNESTRLDYDLTPLGHFYMDDEFRARMRNVDVARAAEMRQAGLSDEQIRDFIKEQDLVWDDGSDPEVVDEPLPTRQDQGSRSVVGHWTWMVKPDGDMAWDWRRSLIQGCVSAGLATEVAVGVMHPKAHPHEISLQALGDQMVVFIDVTVTASQYQDLARRAARQIEHINHIRYQMADVGA